MWGSATTLEAIAAHDDLKKRFDALRAWIAADPTRAPLVKILKGQFDAWDAYDSTPILDRDATALEGLGIDLQTAENTAKDWKPSASAPPSGYVAPGPIIAPVLLDDIPLGNEAEAVNQAAPQIPPIPPVKAIPWWVWVGGAVAAVAAGKIVATAINANPAVALARELVNNRDPRRPRP